MNGRMIKGIVSGAAGVTLLAGALLSGSPAEACGGFFCNRVPVDQTGEQILFAQQGNQIEAHVNIQYQGPSESFAWIVPTPSNPEIGVSTMQLFAQLEWRTGVQYQLQWEQGQNCWWASPEDDFDAGAQNNGGDPNEGVEVVQQSSVGPYDYAVLKADSVDSLFDWLHENEYFVPDEAQPFVEPYIIPDSSMHFVAFKLQKDRETGDIQPVTLKYNSTKPMIPIQLTAIATQPDLGVTVHILGEARAVPENYLHVYPNEALIDWFNYGSNYDQVVIAAMNEAGGQGFTTEYAGPSDVMMMSLFREGMYDTSRLADLTDPVEFFQELQNQGFTGDSQLLGMFLRYIPFPQELADQGTSPQDFYNCLECYRQYLPEEFDAEGFANELEANVVEPLRHAQELFDTIPYLSRMYTTLSAEEMTLDPVFAYNRDMGDVSNLRTATARLDEGQECNENSTVTITLADGREIQQTLTWGNFPLDDALNGGADATERVEMTAETGEPSVVKDLAAGIDELDQVIEDRQNGMTGGPNVNRPDPGNDGITNERGCSVAPTAATPALGLALLALGLLVLRRR